MATGSGSSSQGAGGSLSLSDLSLSLSIFLSSDTKDSLPNCSSLVDPKYRLTMVSEHGLKARSPRVEKKSRKTNPSSSPSTKSPNQERKEGKQQRKNSPDLR
jgi:hypothetical protein